MRYEGKRGLPIAQKAAAEIAGTEYVITAAEIILSENSVQS